jgi:hypothetical protein
MSTPDKISSFVDQPMSEIPPGDDIEAMVARLDKKWRELKKILRAEGHVILEEEEEAEAGALLFPDDPGEGTAPEPDDTCWTSLLPANRVHIDMTAEESEAIIQRVEKLGEESDIREKLTKVQWQNRGLMVYAVICTIIFLYMMVSMFYSHETLAGSPSGSGQAAGLQTAAGAVAASPTAALVPAAPVFSLHDAAPPASPLEASDKAGAQLSPTLVSAAKDAQTPNVEYVGSFTSNKYHYRSCKWTKYIGPRNLRVFTSVAEAQKAGYIRCPTCQPPLSDAVQASAR